VVGGQQPLDDRPNIPPGDIIITQPAPPEVWYGYSTARAITIRKGKVYILNTGNDTVTARDINSSTEATIVFPRNELARATDVAVDSRGRIFIAGAGDHYLIRAYKKNGQRYTPFGVDGEIGVYGQGTHGEGNNGWFNIVIDSNDNIYGLDGNNNRIVKISPEGVIVGSYNGLTGRETNFRLGCDWNSGQDIFLIESSLPNNPKADMVKRLPLDQFSSGQAETVSTLTDVGSHTNIVVKDKLFVLAGNTIKTFSKNGAELSSLWVGAEFVDIAVDKNKKIYALSLSKVRVYEMD